MTTANCPSTIAYPTAEELRVLESRWNEGALASRVDCLLFFADRHGDEIQRRVGNVSDETALIRAVQELIIESGSLHVPAEVRDEVKEISNEIWYRGERGEYDRDRIQEEWTLRHAPAWRRWRVKEYPFVAERSGPLIAARLARTHQ